MNLKNEVMNKDKLPKNMYYIISSEIMTSRNLSEIPSIFTKILIALGIKKADPDLYILTAWIKTTAYSGISPGQILLVQSTENEFQKMIVTQVRTNAYSLETSQYAMPITLNPVFAKIKSLDYSRSQFPQFVSFIILASCHFKEMSIKFMNP